MTDSTATVTVWGEIIRDAEAVGQALHLSPCEALEYAFPAIVKNDAAMQALSILLDPAIEDVSTLVVAGIVPSEMAETFLHNVFHVLQIAAALGHMLGVEEAIGQASVPVDLSDIAWTDLPDTFGEEEA